MAPASIKDPFQRAAKHVFNLRFTAEDLEMVDAATRHEQARTGITLSRQEFCMRACVAAAKKELKASSRRKAGE